MYRSIQQIWVDNTFISSDHCPLMMTLNTGKNPIKFHNKVKHGKGKRRKWSSTTYDNTIKYGKNTERHLSNIQLNHELLLCDNVECTVRAHIRPLTECIRTWLMLYKQLVIFLGNKYVQNSNKFQAGVMFVRISTAVQEMLFYCEEPMASLDMDLFTI